MWVKHQKTIFQVVWMIKKKRWGFRLVLLTVMLCAVAIYAALNYPLITHSSRFLLSCGVMLSIMAIAFGHLSYKRVHNCKVFLLGYLQGFTLFSFFASFLAADLFHAPLPPQNFYSALIILFYVNLLIVIPVKSLVKYSMVRSCTLFMFTIELIIVDICYLSPHATDWIGYIKYNGLSDYFFWAGPVLSMGFVALCATLLKNEFHIGGLIASLSIVLAVVWVYGLDNGVPLKMQQLFMVVAAVVLLTGIMFHWVSKIEHRVVIDPLLQIYNREYCSKIISEQAPMELSPPLSIAMVDIDHFKNVNDTYGHQAGDAVLYTVAQAVHADATSHGGIVCRYGGEELAVFFPGKRVKETAAIMDTCRTAVEKIVTESGKKKIAVTVSVGVAERAESAQSVTQVMNAADKALYKAKKGGRNQVKTGSLRAS
jgi:diguanylate cyclase (GGDEF)-like protein